MTVIYVAYEEECCEGFERAVTPDPEVEYLDEYYTNMDFSFNKYDVAESYECFKKKYTKQLSRYKKSGYLDEMNGKIMLLKDEGNEFYFKVLLEFLERKGYQVRVIRKGQKRL